jgi:uncharacterized coiled-coil protein SlyX
MLDQLAVVDSFDEAELNRVLAAQWATIPTNVLLVLRHLADRIEELEERLDQSDI